MLLDFLIQHFSYAILFVWSLLEGEIGLALAGYMVKQGRFEPETVLAIAISGALLGDMTLFPIGCLFRDLDKVVPDSADTVRDVGCRRHH